MELDSNEDETIVYERLLKNSRSRISKKYLTNKKLISENELSKLLEGKKSTLFAKFSEFLTISDFFTTFMKSYYVLRQSNSRITSIANFCNNYKKIFPNYLKIPFNKVLYKNLYEKHKLINKSERKKESINHSSSDDSYSNHKKRSFSESEENDFQKRELIQGGTLIFNHKSLKEINSLSFVKNKGAKKPINPKLTQNFQSDVNLNLNDNNESVGSVEELIGNIEFFENAKIIKKFTEEFPLKNEVRSNIIKKKHTSSSNELILNKLKSDKDDRYLGTSSKKLLALEELKKKSSKKLKNITENFMMRRSCFMNQLFNKTIKEEPVQEYKTKLAIFENAFRLKEKVQPLNTEPIAKNILIKKKKDMPIFNPYSQYLKTQIFMTETKKSKNDSISTLFNRTKTGIHSRFSGINSTLERSNIEIMRKINRNETSTKVNSLMLEFEGEAKINISSTKAIIEIENLLKKKNSLKKKIVKLSSKKPSNFRNKRLMTVIGTK